jgi:hypothetical protein
MLVLMELWSSSCKQSVEFLLLKNIFFITPVYLQSVQNTMSKWEETETNGEEESSKKIYVTLIVALYKISAN